MCSMPRNSPIRPSAELLGEAEEILVEHHELLRRRGTTSSRDRQRLLIGAPAHDSHSVPEHVLEGRDRIQVGGT